MIFFRLILFFLLLSHTFSGSSDDSSNEDGDEENVDKNDNMKHHKTAIADNIYEEVMALLESGETKIKLSHKIDPKTRQLHNLMKKAVC